MPCSNCHESGHNKRTCPSVRPSAAGRPSAADPVQMCWTCDTRPSTHRTYRDDLDGYEFLCDECYDDVYPSSESEDDDDDATGVEKWTHPKSGKIYLRDPALVDGEQDIFDYEEFLESGEALQIGWFSPNTGEITFDGEENKVEYESEDEEISDEDDWMLTDEQIGSLAPPPAWIWWEGETEELWDGDVPEDFGWSEAELDGRILTYTAESDEEFPIFEDAISATFTCECKGRANHFHVISDWKMEEMHGTRSMISAFSPHKWDFASTGNFFYEPDQTGDSVETENCGQKFCCGELYHEVMADQFAYSCDERDCGCSHSIQYFDYGGYCDDCTEEECYTGECGSDDSDCEETSD